MNTIVTEFLISLILFISFGVIPAYAYLSYRDHNNNNQESYLTLDDIPNTNLTQI